MYHFSIFKEEKAHFVLMSWVLSIEFRLNFISFTSLSESKWKQNLSDSATHFQLSFQSINLIELITVFGWLSKLSCRLIHKWIVQTKTVHWTIFSYLSSHQKSAWNITQSSIEANQYNPEAKNKTKLNQQSFQHPLINRQSQMFNMWETHS